MNRNTRRKLLQLIRRLARKIYKLLLSAWFEAIETAYMQIFHSSRLINASDLIASLKLYELEVATRNRIEAERANEKGAIASEEREPDEALPLGCEYIPFGDQKLPLSSIEGHFLVMGVPGSGKTLISYATLTHILRNISKKRVILFDPKGDAISVIHALGVKYKYFNISSVRGCRWAVERDFDSYTSLLDIAQILIPDDGSAEKFWLEASWSVLVGIISTFIYLKVDWKFHDILKASRLPREKLIEFLNQFPGNHHLIHTLFSEEVEKVAANVMAEITAKLSRLYNAACHSQQATEDISLKEFMQQEGVLVIGMDNTAMKSSQPIVGAMFKRLVDLILSQEERPEIRTFLFIEECFFLGKLPSFADLLTVSRSKHAIAWIISQGLEGFTAIYKKDIGEFLVNLCVYVIAFRSTPPTAKWLSSLFGQILKYKRKSQDNFAQSGLSGGGTVGEEKEQQYQDSVFLDIPRPSKETGLTGFYISPSKAGKHSMTPEEVDEIKAPTAAVSPEEKLPLEKQILWNWTYAEEQKFIYGNKDGVFDSFAAYEFDREAAQEAVREWLSEFLKTFKSTKSENEGEEQNEDLE